jgi:hypothetical protein
MGIISQIKKLCVCVGVWADHHFRGWMMDVVEALSGYVNKIVTSVEGMKVLLLDEETVLYTQSSPSLIL